VSDPDKRPVVAIIGLGETGVLTATNLPARDFRVVGISTKPVLVSGQEVGSRLVDRGQWQRDYITALDRFRGLDGHRVVVGQVVSVDPAAREIAYRQPDGTMESLAYDTLVIASGVTNGFWRDDRMASLAEIEAEDRAREARIATATTIAVIGGGPTGASMATNLAIRHPDKQVSWYYPGAHPLPGYHPDTVADIEARAATAGVALRPGHRAISPGPDELAANPGTGPVSWQTGQAPGKADLVFWAVGVSRPNTGFVPAQWLDEHGYVRTEPSLQVPGHPEVFAIGDVAATDPLRSSARNWAYRILASNIAALHAGDMSAIKPFEPPAHRWGSILGVQADGMVVYSQQGKRTRFRRWVVRWLLYPLVVRKQIYGGIRRDAGISA
jgi:NADH dehydrogenase FAD-containing subunit